MEKYVILEPPLFDIFLSVNQPVGDGKQNDVSPAGDMMFRLRSNDVAPKGRNDVPFVRDKRYFHSVGEGFPLPSIVAK